MAEEIQEKLGRKQGSGNSAAASPCAACKLLRRRRVQGCIFAPYFPADEPQKFANVHEVFGASNVGKLLKVNKAWRSDTASSLVYKANARMCDPVYGCVAAISSLLQQIELLKAHLALAQAEIVHLNVQHAAYLACCTKAATPLS